MGKLAGVVGRLEATLRLSELLAHLYVLLPVLDDDKHYWIGDEEVEKLLRHGEGWLSDHPEREAIAQRYLKHRPRLAREAIARLAGDDGEDPDAEAESKSEEEAALERRMSLAEQRTGSVLSVLRSIGARSVVDLGCGEGRLIRALLEDRTFERIVGMDVSWRALTIAGERLHLDRRPEAVRRRVELLHGSLVYRDARLAGFDAATVIEVVEHLDPGRLAAFQRVLFEAARPRAVVLTTPNREFNVRFESLPAGQLRHRDHRFEWSRAEFRGWAEEVAKRFGYRVRFLAVGTEDLELGTPTQMAVFERSEVAP